MTPPVGPLRLHLDASRCDGHGICALRCPERIQLDEWGFAVVDERALDAPGMPRRAANAVAACPGGALSLTPLVEPAPHTGDVVPPATPALRRLR